MSINCVILCGGSGTRLWPLSRKKIPKQFLSLTNDKTMLQNTICRLKELSNITIDKYILICNKEHYFLVESQIEQLKLEKEYLIVIEPQGRDTAPAIATSSLLSNENDITIVLPSDHVFNDIDFCQSIETGIQYVNNSIVTFGIMPTTPETGYGYIETNNEYKTISFKEKPNVELAWQYVCDGRYLWNAGIFMFESKSMIECFRKYAPDIIEACRITLENSKTTNRLIELSSEYFMKSKCISVDYAIMEKLTNDSESIISAYTIPYKSKWSDIGSFKALYEECEKDAQKNVTNGSVMYKSRNCYVNSEKEVACIGINNMIVVDTKDALLLCDMESSQEIKNVIHLIKNKDLLDIHTKAYRPWGWYINIEGGTNTGFKVKRIGVYPGKRLSLQSHNRRSEHWVIVKGNAIVQVGNNFHNMTKDQYIYIPVKELHRIENVGEEILEFVETQIGDYLGEDDIVRYEDDFGRV